MKTPITTIQGKMGFPSEAEKIKLKFQRINIIDKDELQSNSKFLSHTKRNMHFFMVSMIHLEILKSILKSILMKIKLRKKIEKG